MGIAPGFPRGHTLSVGILLFPLLVMCSERIRWLVLNVNKAALGSASVFRKRAVRCLSSTLPSEETLTSRGKGKWSVT